MDNKTCLFCHNQMIDEYGYDNYWCKDVLCKQYLVSYSRKYCYLSVSDNFNIVYDFEDKLIIINKKYIIDPKTIFETTICKINNSLSKLIFTPQNIEEKLKQFLIFL